MKNEISPVRMERGKRAHRSGQRAEKWAALLLQLKFYRILARRMKTHAGEIDLIARRGRVLVFVEVKNRREAETAAYALAPQQRARLARAAGLYIAARPHLQDLDMRFDVVLVSAGALPRHMPDAWRP